MSVHQYRWLLGGGIGSGKSAVRQLLAESGVSTVDADSIGHQVSAPNGPAFAEIAARWPSVVLTERIDRSALARIVFSAPDELAELERITHPHILATIAAMIEGASGPVVVEIPLLRLAPPGEWRRIVVDCDDSIRLGRLIERGMSADDAKARMEAQPRRAEWLAVADVVVPNHEGLSDLANAVSELLPVLSGSRFADPVSIAADDD